MTRDLVVSIINYRTADLTVACARSVLDQFGGDADCEIVIVDNCSGDGSPEVIETWIRGLPEGAPVRLVRSPMNTGFSGGHNIGMGAVCASHYLVLNSDTVLRPGFVASILATAHAHPEAGFVVPRLEGPDGAVQNSCFRFPGPLSELLRGANSGPVTRALKSYDVALGPNPRTKDIDWASFACILLNGNMVHEIGPMDEGYFLYFEDVEYCLRARRAGWGLTRCPEAVAVHFKGGSGPVKSLAAQRARLPRYYYSSRTRFLYQAHGWIGLWAANFLWTIGRAFAGMRHLLGRRGNNFRRAELRDIWTNISNPLGPRHAPGE
jgi:GT2 family glycosyltransferase